MMKKAIVIVVCVIFALGAIFQIYVEVNNYEAKDIIYDYVSEEDYSYKDGIYYFEPQVSNGKAIMFYNGGLVDPFAYGYLAKLLANEGYLVVLPKFFDDLSIFSPLKGSDIIEDNPSYDWYVMGHSLGGVSGTNLAVNNDNVKAVILLASYPTKNTSLREYDVDVLSIVGSSDLVVNKENYEEYKNYLPLDTTYITIEGANHAYYGMYGMQKGDGEASISVIEQHKQVVSAIVSWENK